MQSDQQRQLATDYIAAEEYSPRVRMAEWGFKVLFKFFGIVASLLSLLSVGRDRSRTHS